MVGEEVVQEYCKNKYLHEDEGEKVPLNDKAYFQRNPHFTLENLSPVNSRDNARFLPPTRSACHDGT
jgi:hypothetical protein